MYCTYIFIHVYNIIYIYILYIYIREHNKLEINQVYELEKMIHRLEHNVNWKTSQAITTKLTFYDHFVIIY